MPYNLIRQNKARCLHCKDVLVSKEGEGDVEIKCSCGKLTISGGHAFLLRAGTQGVDYEEMSEMNFEDCPGVNEETQELPKNQQQINDQLIDALKQKFNK